MYQIDHHTHTTFSPDAAYTMAQMAEAAYQAGLEGITFTEHLEWMPGDGATGYLDLDAYFAELHRIQGVYEGRLWVRCGVEMGSSHLFPEEAHAISGAHPWDIILGSNHWAGGIPGWEPVAFEDGSEAAYRRYFEDLVPLARHGVYDVLAHFDLVRRDSWSHLQQELPLEPFSDLIREALRAVVTRGKGLEINTSAWGMGLPEPCPNLAILRWYRELGGETLVLGSDAHRPWRIGQFFARACDYVRAAGFHRLAYFAERRVVRWIDL
ncbi:MAG: histidinol-phosphatase HisJ family protein [Anaerolineae bacterium]|nr:histidinol-phosphatase HisJ family protein [Anaerolineae bacterium]